MTTGRINQVAILRHAAGPRGRGFPSLRAKRIARPRSRALARPPVDARRSRPPRAAPARPSPRVAAAVTLPRAGRKGRERMHGHLDALSRRLVCRTPGRRRGGARIGRSTPRSMAPAVTPSRPERPTPPRGIPEDAPSLDRLAARAVRCPSYRYKPHVSPSRQLNRRRP